MAGYGDTPPPGQQQQAPAINDLQFDKLEQRIRKLEDTINWYRGVLSVIRWVVPTVITVVAVIFFMSRSSSYTSPSDAPVETCSVCNKRFCDSL